MNNDDRAAACCGCACYQILASKSFANLRSRAVEHPTQHETASSETVSFAGVTTIRDRTDGALLKARVHPLLIETNTSTICEGARSSPPTAGAKDNRSPAGARAT